MINIFDITAFGAVGDGAVDCTAAIQSALDAAGEVRGCVVIPPGNYLCGHVTVPPQVRVEGKAAWSFHDNGLSNLILIDDEQPCLLDITGAIGCTISGVCLDGRQLGQDIHGIMLENESFGFFRGANEDTPTIEDCRVTRFSGNAVHLECAWCFSLRRNMLHGSGGHGVSLSGCDGFISENWFTGNKGAGFFVDCIGSALTFTGNRVEWNRMAGLYLAGAESVQVTGNYFDRTGGPAIDMNNDEGMMSESITITGNLFKRSGAGDVRFDIAPEDPQQSCHVRMERCVNVTLSGNTCRVGQGDGTSGGLQSPDYGFVMRHLRGAVITGNAMHCGAMKETILDLGEHEGDVLAAQNIGQASNDTDNWQPKLDQ